MDVLLISPKDPKVPSSLKFLMGGENTYTQTLLANPPKGIQYTHHVDALKKGEMEYLPMQRILSNLIKFRTLPMDSGYHCIRLRKRFDLIYCHGYNLLLSGDILPPVILGDSSSNYLFLRDYLGWPEMQIRLQYALRGYIHKKLGILDRDLNLQNAYKLIVFSEFAKKIHVSLGADPRKIAVVYPGIPEPKLMKKKPSLRVRDCFVVPPRNDKKGVEDTFQTGSKRLNILFAGVWFERKGGVILLKAYEILKMRYPYIHLTLLGPMPKNVKINNKEITQIDFVSYDRLLGEYYPTADIFVLVPPKAEGFGMVTVEAASFGIPTVVSKVYALPEIVVHGKTGLVVHPGDVDALVKALEKLILNPILRKEMGEAGRKRYYEKFTTIVMNTQLLRIFHEACKNNY